MFTLAKIRAQIPALSQTMNGHPILHLDTPAGMQVAQSVIDAVSQYYITSNSNIGGLYSTSLKTQEIIQKTRELTATFIHAARPEEIVFGLNMTSLTFALSRSIAHTWQAGDNIILSSLDHQSNLSPWETVAKERGVTVHYLPLIPETCSLNTEAISHYLDERTKLVAVTLASNISGSLVPVNSLITEAQRMGALVFLDAVHYAPHHLLDVQALKCDFLACSAYKFGSPHIGFLYGQYQHLDHLTAYKLAANVNLPPDKWESGTKSFESIAGLLAALTHLQQICQRPDLSARQQFVESYRQMHVHEQQLSQRFLSHSQHFKALQIIGITDIQQLEHRTPTFALTSKTCSLKMIVEHLAQQGICAGLGYFHAHSIFHTLQLEPLLRLGFGYYHTVEEVDRVCKELAKF